jgi:hypothetical protein
VFVFDPERWLDGRVQVTTSLGVYGNLYETSVIWLKHSNFFGRMTFGSGHHACIGILPCRIPVLNSNSLVVVQVGDSRELNPAA